MPIEIIVIVVATIAMGLIVGLAIKNQKAKKLVKEFAKKNGILLSKCYDYQKKANDEIAARKAVEARLILAEISAEQSKDLANVYKRKLANLKQRISVSN